MYQFIKTFLLSCLFVGVISPKSPAQNRVSLSGQSGVNLSYQLFKLEESDKKIRYRLLVTAENGNAHDIFYSIAMKKQADGQFRLNSYENMSLCEVYPKNATGLMGVLMDAAKITGSETKIITKNNEVLFKLAKGQVLTSELRFNVKPGQTPDITSKFNRPIRKIEEFDMSPSGESLTAGWISNCGNISMTLKSAQNDKGQQIILQSVNGRQNTWLMISENVYEKPGDKQATLTFNKTGNIYTYSNTDGVVCIWSRK